MDKVKVGIVGGSGYTGGELLRVLLQHPNVEVVAVTSRQYKGKPLHRVHPNLRGVAAPKFIDPEDLPSVDVLFTGLPHGTVMDQIDRFTGAAEKVLDLSSDFRLKNPDDYVTWYDHEHSQKPWLDKFVYGMPELHRKAIKSANYVAVPGCTATSAILPLKPLAETFEITNVIIDAKVGSSAGGASVSLSTHHPERSGVVRSFKPSGHRHTAEMIQELGLPIEQINFSPHAVELIRGILATCHVFIDGEFDEKDVWQAYLKHYKEEPFIRIIKERGGLYRFPEPKLVSGTNLCDIGFEKDPNTGRLVVMAAIDNLMKGAAGQAVQCFNLMCGFNEATALTSLGFHPI
jgi:N-acetyl-gamma-glutamyl-phosphate/LysW-gamma-L-alpha-aminoadipyl-6-phosphate reductase